MVSQTLETRKRKSDSDDILTKTEEYVKREIAKDGHDGSHDWWHIVRVRNTAIQLAKEEGLSEDSLEVVQLAALLHDLKDWKYSGSATAGVEAAEEVLRSQEYDPEKTKQVLAVIQHIGFKDELGGKAFDPTPELRVVQDADRLDAIGAIGIARTFTFGGRFNRVLHDPSVAPRTELTKEQYMSGGREQTTLNHFPEKLLKLKGLMKTRAGRRLAEARHQVMVDFLDQFKNEWDGIA